MQGKQEEDNYIWVVIILFVFMIVKSAIIFYLLTEIIGR